MKASAFLLVVFLGAAGCDRRPTPPVPATPAPGQTSADVPHGSATPNQQGTGGKWPTQDAKANPKTDYNR